MSFLDARPVRTADYGTQGQVEDDDFVLPFALTLAERGPAAAVVQWAMSPETMVEQRAGYRYGRLRDTTVSRRIALVEAYNRANDEIFNSTGVRLENPEDTAFWDPVGAPVPDLLSPDAPLPASVERWHARVADLAANDARLSAYTRQALHDRATALRREATGAYQQELGEGGMMDQLMRGLELAPGMIVGALSTGAPEQISQLGAGGAGRFGGVAMGPMETAAARFGAGASANIVAQGAIEPAIIADAQRMGEEYGAAQVALDFILAGVLGGALELGGGGAPVVRSETPLRGFATARPPLLPLDEPGSGAVLQEALTGRAESLGVSAIQRDAATAQSLPDGFIDIDGLTEQLLAADRYIRGETDSAPISEVGRRAPASEVEAAARQADDGPTPSVGDREMVSINGRSRVRSFERFAPNALAFDPATFQFRRSEGQTGSTGHLAGVEVWDGQSAGKIVVFEAADGRLYVADGHQRVALAQSLQAAGEQQIALDGYRYRAVDGWTEREVRNLAAQKNLREGNVDPVDAATLLRDAPELVDSSIPQRGANFRVARSLARLSDEAFATVRAGRLKPELGAIIGDVAASRPELHAPLADMFQRDPPANGRDAAFIVREAMSAAVVRMEAAQLSMFGDDALISGMRERAEVLHLAGNMLREDKRLFAAAERHADELEAAGNVMATEANARRADLAAALVRELDALATRPGPVADALREITARGVSNKTSTRDAAREFVEAVSGLLDERGLIALKQAEPPPLAPPPAHMTDWTQRVERDARAAELRHAHDQDSEALTQTLAEIALERAMRGEVGDVIPEDALGRTPEADLARIEDAAEALGLDPDFTEMQVAAAILAKPDAAMEVEARARIALTDEADGRFESFAEAAEQGAEIEPPFAPDGFTDEAALREAADAATLPELEAVAREMGAERQARTRAEYIVLMSERIGNAPDSSGEGAFARGGSEGPDAGRVAEGKRATAAEIRAADREADMAFGRLRMARQMEQMDGNNGKHAAQVEEAREAYEAANARLEALRARGVPDGGTSVDGPTAGSAREALREADNLDRIVRDLKDCK